MRDFIDDNGDLLNDLSTIQKWCDIHWKNILIRTLDMDTLILKDELDFNTGVETIELLKTVENNDVYYHILLNSEGFLKPDTIIHQVRWTCVSYENSLCKTSREQVWYSHCWKVQKSERGTQTRTSWWEVNESEHFKPSISWNWLSSKQMNHSYAVLSRMCLSVL